LCANGICGEWKLWKMEILEIVDNGNCGKVKLWIMEIVENGNFGKQKLWKMESLEPLNPGKLNFCQTPTNTLVKRL
jgi:hypothetical protein